jgi:hypothetical protein
MAIHSSNFGITKLTKEDAKQFHRQVAHGRPGKAAIASLKEGRKLLKEIQIKGFARITPKFAR